MSMEIAVHSKRNQSIRQFILGIFFAAHQDRPKALNALNLDMVYTITPQLKAWQDSELCKVIIMSNLPGSKGISLLVLFSLLCWRRRKIHRLGNPVTNT
jgi:hypothetical protein